MKYQKRIKQKRCIDLQIGIFQLSKIDLIHQIKTLKMSAYSFSDVRVLAKYYILKNIAFLEIKKTYFFLTPKNVFSFVSGQNLFM